jgi:WD40 repeat protein
MAEEWAHPGPRSRTRRAALLHPSDSAASLLWPVSPTGRFLEPDRGGRVLVNYGRAARKSSEGLLARVQSEKTFDRVPGVAVYERARRVVRPASKVAHAAASTKPAATAATPAAAADASGAEAATTAAAAASLQAAVAASAASAATTGRGARRTEAATEQIVAGEGSAAALAAGAEEEAAPSAPPFEPTPVEVIHSRLLEQIRVGREQLESGATEVDEVDALSQADKAARELTPRSEYSRAQQRKLQQRVAIMMRLNRRAMEGIRQQFERRVQEGGLDIYEFVVVCRDFLQSLGHFDQDSVEALCEMFREIDVNGDGTMTWDEFTSHLVELANTYYIATYQENAQLYVAGIAEDRTRHEYHVELVRFLPSVRAFLVIERRSQVFKIYSSELRLMQIVRGHRGAVLAAADLGEHGMVATSSADGTIAFWEARRANSFKLLYQWQLAHPQAAIYWSGESLYTCESTGDVLKWNVDVAEVALRLVGHSDVALAVVELPRLDIVASASIDTTVRLWSTSSGEQTSCLRGHDKPLHSLVFSERCGVLASGGLDPYVQLWNPRLKKPVFTIRNENPQAHCVGLELVMEQRELVIADNYGVFQVFDLEQHAALQTFAIAKLDGPSLSSFALDPRSTVLVAGAAQLYQFRKVAESNPQVAHELPVLAALFNPLTLSFVTAGGDSVKVWDALTGRLEREYKALLGEGVPVTCLALDARMRRFVAGSHNGDLSVFNFGNGAFMKRLDPHSAEVISVTCVAADRLEIVSASLDGTCCRHDDSISAECTVLRRATDHTKGIATAVVSSALKLIATGGADCQVLVYSMQLSTPVGRCEGHEAPITAMLFLEPTPLLAVADQAGTITLWWVRNTIARVFSWSNVRDGRPDYVTGLAFDRECQTLFTCDCAGFLRAWSLGHIIMPLLRVAQPQRNSARLSILAFHPFTLEKQQRARRASAAASAAAAATAAAAAAQAVHQTPPPPQRRKSLIALPLRRGPSSGPESLIDVCMRLSTSTPPPQPAWEAAAHADAAVGVSVVEAPNTPPCVLSYGSDGCAHLWNARTGKRLGSLQQGYTRRASKAAVPWDFRPDVEQRRAREEREVSDAHAAIDMRAEEWRREIQQEERSRVTADVSRLVSLSRSEYSSTSLRTRRSLLTLGSQVFHLTQLEGDASTATLQRTRSRRERTGASGKQERREGEAKQREENEEEEEEEGEDGGDREKSKRASGTRAQSKAKPAPQRAMAKAASAPRLPAPAPAHTLPPRAATPATPSRRGRFVFLRNGSDGSAPKLQPVAATPARAEARQQTATLRVGHGQVTLSKASSAAMLKLERALRAAPRTRAPSRANAQH